MKPESLNALLRRGKASPARGVALSMGDAKLILDLRRALARALDHAENGDWPDWAEEGAAVLREFDNGPHSFKQAKRGGA